MADRETELRKLIAGHGQEHVWRWWDELDEAGRERLLGCLERIDFDELERLMNEHVKSPSTKFDGELTPVEILPAGDGPQLRRKRARSGEIGEKLLRDGKVAAFVVAGGQGTRLGFDGPKGAFPITPVHNKTLFQLHAERILAASRRYGKPIPWCVMTSEATDAPTREFFTKHDNFGLPDEDVLFCVQDMMPCVSGEGKLLLAAKDRPAMSPNGHGGSITALYDSGILEALERRGIEIISYFQVDNVLVKPLDPVFIGHHAEASAEMSSKVMRKRDWSEKLGIIGHLDGRDIVVEYIDMDEDLLKEKGPDGGLKYWAGSIAIHLFNVDFVRRLNETDTALPFHASPKKIPFIDDDGGLIKPGEPNGLKFERFVFDALPMAKETVTMEVLREEEFSPIKNPDDAGQDCPACAEADLQKMWGRWLDRSGVAFPVEEDDAPAVRIEVSPLTALDADELKRKLPDDFSVTGDVDL